MENARKPTLAEAVDILKRNEVSGPSYQRRCIMFWRTHYGDQYADLVTKMLEAKGKKK